MNFEQSHPSNYRPSVHFLKQLKLILHITLEVKNPTYVSFTFFDSDHYYEKLRKRVKRESFDYTMLVNNRTMIIPVETDYLYAVMFKNQE